MFLMKLKEMYSSLTLSEMKVADYLTGHREVSENITGEELARLANVSKSTITRFSQKLGYTNIRNLLNDYSKDEPDGELFIQKKDTAVKVCESLQQVYMGAIQATVGDLDYDDVNEAVRLLKNTKQVVCFGTHISQCIARYFALKLGEIGYNAVCDDNLYMISAAIHNMDPSGVVFIVSHRGLSYSSRRVAEMAKERGLSVIALSGLDGGEIRRMADITLTTHLYSVHAGLAYSAIKCSQLYLADVLFLNLYKDDAEKYDETSVEIFRSLSFECGSDDWEKNLG